MLDGYLEHRYWAQADDAYRLRIIEAPAGFASRGAGELVRRKCINILADPKAALVVDWSGIQIVSSSFADEVMAKLRVELGSGAFNRRVRSDGMTDEVRDAIGRSFANRPSK